MLCQREVFKELEQFCRSVSGPGIASWPRLQRRDVAGLVGLVPALQVRSRVLVSRARAVIEMLSST